MSSIMERRALERQHRAATLFQATRRYHWPRTSTTSSTTAVWLKFCSREVQGESGVPRRFGGMLTVSEKGAGHGNGGRRGNEHARPAIPAPNRTALNGMGEFLLTQVRRGASEQQWADWLKVPFEHACLAWDMSTIKRLLEAGVNGPYDRPRDPRFRRHTLLHLSAACGNTEVVNTLLRWGSAPDVACREPGEKAYTPLHRAALGGHGEASRVLIKAGADKNARTGGSGASPLHLAARRGHEDCVRILLLTGADKDARRALDGATPLHQAAFFGQMGAVRELLEAVANPNAQDAEGCTPVFLAAQEGHEEVVVDLIRNGASPDVCREDGWTPLHAAARFGHTCTVAALLDEGQADFEAPTGDHGSTPLHVAAISGFDEVVGVLMDIGSDLEALDSGGWTPLHCACAAARASCVNALLQRGADPSAMTPDGQRPSSLIATDLAEGDEPNEETNQTILKMLRIPRSEFEARRRRHIVKHAGSARPPPPYNNRPPPAYGPDSVVAVFDSGGSGSATGSVSGSYSGEGCRQLHRSPSHEHNQHTPVVVGGAVPGPRNLRRGGVANGPLMDNGPVADGSGRSRGRGTNRGTPRGGEVAGGPSNKRPVRRTGSDGAQPLSYSAGGGGTRARTPSCEERSPPGRSLERNAERSVERFAERGKDEQVGGADVEDGRAGGYGYNANHERPSSHDNRISTRGVVAYPLRRSPKNDGGSSGDSGRSPVARGVGSRGLSPPGGVNSQPQQQQAKGQGRPITPPELTKNNQPSYGGTRSKSPPDGPVLKRGGGNGGKSPVAGGVGSRGVSPPGEVNPQPQPQQQQQQTKGKGRPRSPPELTKNNPAPVSSGAKPKSPPDGATSKRGGGTAQPKARPRSPPDVAGSKALKTSEPRPRFPATEAAVKRIRARQEQQEREREQERQMQQQNKQQQRGTKSPQKIPSDEPGATPKAASSDPKHEGPALRFAGVDGQKSNANEGVGGATSTRNAAAESKDTDAIAAGDVAAAGSRKVMANGGKSNAPHAAAAGDPESKPGGRAGACDGKKEGGEGGTQEGLPRLLSRPYASLRAAAVGVGAAIVGSEGPADRESGVDKDRNEEGEGMAGDRREVSAQQHSEMELEPVAPSSLLHDGRRSSAGRVSGAFDSGISVDVGAISTDDGGAAGSRSGSGGVGIGAIGSRNEVGNGSGDVSSGDRGGNGNGNGAEDGKESGKGIGSSGVGSGSGAVVGGGSGGRRDDGAASGTPRAAFSRGNGTARAGNSSSRASMEATKGLVAKRLAAFDPFSYSKEDAASSARPAGGGKSKSYRARF